MPRSLFLSQATLDDAEQEAVERYNDFIQHHRFDEALSQLNDMLEDSPEEINLLMKHAELNYEIGLLYEALASLRDVIQYHPAHVDALKLRISIRLDLKQFADVLGDATKILEGNDRDEFALLSRMTAYTRLRDIKAIDDAYRVLSMCDPSSDHEAFAQAYFCRAILTPYQPAHLRGIRSNLDKCIQHAEQTMSERKLFFKALLLRGKVHTDQRNFGLALEDLNSYLDGNSQSVEGLKARIIVHKALGNKEQVTLDEYAIFRVTHRKLTKVEKAEAILLWAKEQQEGGLSGQKRTHHEVSSEEPIRRTQTM